jgi:hypothetical protein
MSEHTVYGCTRSVGSRIYRVSGYSSPEEAEFAAMSMASGGLQSSEKSGGSFGDRLNTPIFKND